MCGITGIFAFNEIGRFNLPNLSRATKALQHRGPDHQNIYLNDFVGLGHRRLSIIDLSSDAHQPMASNDGRYQIVFNGEIFNFRQLRQDLERKGVTFKSHSDTEVLLKLLIHEGIDSLPKLNGFFAFAFYDAEKHEMLLARDRFGIKPLQYYQDEDKFLFGSELSSIMAFGIEKEIDLDALITYLQLNYLPAPFSMLKNVSKLAAGHYMRIQKKSVEVLQYYQPQEGLNTEISYEEAKTRLRTIITESVQKRMVSDVPLGSFLSGGIDSSIVATLAAKQTDQLHTFSIGYKNQPFFDETEYALAVAKRIGSNHHVFKLSFDDLYDNLSSFLEHFSEPFADSSALAVYTLSKKTKEQVTVALSGDGADEIFAGYNKHMALFKLANMTSIEKIAASQGWLWKSLPKSRNNKFSNLFRQLDKFSEASNLNFTDQYWLLLSIQSEEQAINLINQDFRDNSQFSAFKKWKKNTLEQIEQGSITSGLKVDQTVVLEGDMLQKVDLMSMSQGLEVRVPFMDHQLVEFANSLPQHYKIDRKFKKRILQDTFRNDLPELIFNRPKHGFEVPMLDWLRTSLSKRIETDWLNDDYVKQQGIFSLIEIRELKKKLHSRNPEDSHAHVWALIVFQEWYKKFIETS